MKLTTFSMLLCFTVSLWAQDLKFSAKTYTWGSTLPQFKPSEEDSKSATTYVFMNRTVEYAWDSKGEDIEMYFVSHHLKSINDDKSIEDNNKIYVSTSETDNLLYVKARVIANGKVVHEASQKDFIQVEEEKNTYNMIALKGVTKGVLIETIVGYKLDVELYGYEQFQLTNPIKKGTFMLITPGKLKFNSKVYNGTGIRMDTVYEDRRITTTTFSNIAAIDAEEKYSLINSNKLRVEYVYAQNVETNKKYMKWPEMGRIFFDRMNKDYDKNIKDLDNILSKMKINQYKSDEEKAFAIENFLKTNVSIENNAEDVGSFTEVLKMRYTYQYKLNQMYAQLYRRSGIPFEIVMTCAKDYKRFDPDFDSWTYLQNVVFFFPGVNKYCDPRASLYRLGQINSDYLGQSGLYIKAVSIGETVSASASVKPIPGNKPEDSKDIELYTATLSKDLSSTTIDYHREMNGYAEQGLRGVYYIMDEEKRKELMEGFVKGIADDGKVSELQVSNYDITKKEVMNTPFTISAKISTAHYIENAGDDKFLFKVGELIGQQMEMYQAKPRVNPVDIDFAHSYQRKIIVNIPKGYTAKGLEKLNFSHTYVNAQQAPSFGFTSSYEVQSDKIIITCNEYYNSLNYPTQQFNDFKGVINDAADFNKISILFEQSK